MTVTKIRMDVSAVKQVMATDKQSVKPLIHTALQEVLEAVMTEAARRLEGGAPRGPAWLPLRLISALTGHGVG
jgi:hypothetical protein